MLHCIASGDAQPRHAQAARRAPPRPARRRACRTVAAGAGSPCANRKGTNRVSTKGLTTNFMFLDRGTFWVSICRNLSISVNIYRNLTSLRTFFPNLKIHYFCNDTISVDPICPQPSQAQTAFPHVKEGIIGLGRRNGTKCGFFAVAGFPFVRVAVHSMHEMATYTRSSLGKHYEVRLVLQHDVTLKPQQKLPMRCSHTLP